MDLLSLQTTVLPDYTIAVIFIFRALGTVDFFIDRRLLSAGGWQG